MKIKIGNKKVITSKPISFQSQLLLMYLLEPIVLTIVRYFFSRMSIYGFAREFVIFIITFIPLIYFIININNIKGYKYQAFLALWAVVCFAFLISYISHPGSEFLFTRENYGLVRVLRPDCAMYAFLFIGMYDEPDELINTIVKYAYLDFGYRIIFFLIPALVRGYWVDTNYRGIEMHFSYNLSFGYAIMFPSIVFLYMFFKTHKLRYISLAFVGIFFAFTQGSRGAIIVAIAFIGLMLVNNILKSPYISYKILKVSLLFIGMILLIIYGKIILESILTFLSSLGIQSRTLSMMLEGEITDDTGRSVIWGTVIEAIKNGGIFGYGAYGDRPFVYPLHNAAYSHNIFLELICGFGIIGALIIIKLIIDFIMMIFFCKENKWKEIYIIFFAASCQLFLSMSFWYVWQFWALLAVTYKYKYLKKDRQK